MLRFCVSEDLKQQLNEYAALINNQWAQTGKTIHQILSGATRYRHKLDIDATALPYRKPFREAVG